MHFKDVIRNPDYISNKVLNGFIFTLWNRYKENIVLAQFVT